jgi:hypothetical protein
MKIDLVREVLILRELRLEIDRRMAPLRLIGIVYGGVSGT